MKVSHLCVASWWEWECVMHRVYTVPAIISSRMTCRIRKVTFCQPNEPRNEPYCIYGQRKEGQQCCTIPAARCVQCVTAIDDFVASSVYIKWSSKNVLYHPEPVQYNYPFSSIIHYTLRTIFQQQSPDRPLSTHYCYLKRCPAVTIPFMDICSSFK